MSEEEYIQQPRYRQKRRFQQRKLERQVRKTRRRINRLRVLWKFFLLIMLIFFCYNLRTKNL